MRNRSTAWSARPRRPQPGRAALYRGAVRRKTYGALVSSRPSSDKPAAPLRVAGLFAGIGGIELGLHDADFETTLLCEIDPAASAVLTERFRGVDLVADVADVDTLSGYDVVTAGFPCQDLSQAGRTAGITGERSGLVGRVFELLDDADPDWLVLENVPFMLQLDRGEAMRFLTSELDRRGFSWAYRVVDTRAFGLPQRRQRVLLVASRRLDPRAALFADDAGEPRARDHAGEACGFYWTEGVRGLGWAVDAIPTLKGGSTVGIPSPPAIWFPGEVIATPDLRDAERLQGFEAGWTEPAMTVSRKVGARWKLVGNAVSVPVAKWLGRRLREPGTYDGTDDPALPVGARWPRAAWGSEGRVAVPPVSMWPLREPIEPLAEFLRFDPVPLSMRATAGFLSRLQSSTLRRPAAFERDLETHLERQRAAVLAAA